MKPTFVYSQDGLIIIFQEAVMSKNVTCTGVEAVMEHPQ
jgi:hypothetical protein